MLAQIYSSDPAGRGIAMSRATMGIMVGVSVGPAVGGVLSTVNHWLPFVAIGSVIAMAIAVAFHAFGPDLHPGAALVAGATPIADDDCDEQQGPPAASDAVARVGDAGLPPSAGSRSPLLVPCVAACLGVLLLANLMMALLEATSGLFLEVTGPRHYSVSAAGGLYACNTAASVVAVPIAGYLGVAWVRHMRQPASYAPAMRHVYGSGGHHTILFPDTGCWCGCAALRCSGERSGAGWWLRWVCC